MVHPKINPIYPRNQFSLLNFDLNNLGKNVIVHKDFIEKELFGVKSILSDIDSYLLNLESTKVYLGELVLAISKILYIELNHCNHELVYFDLNNFDENNSYGVFPDIGIIQRLVRLIDDSISFNQYMLSFKEYLPTNIVTNFFDVYSIGFLKNYIAFHEKMIYYIDKFLPGPIIEFIELNSSLLFIHKSQNEQDFVYCKYLIDRFGLNVYDLDNYISNSNQIPTEKCEEIIHTFTYINESKFYGRLRHIQ